MDYLNNNNKKEGLTRTIVPYKPNPCIHKVHNVDSIMRPLNRMFNSLVMSFKLVFSSNTTGFPSE